MIIDFTLENFRSIKEAQTLSLYVNVPKEHLANNVAYPANEKIGALRTLGIYGANASGKSNLLRGFSALKYLGSVSGDLKEDAPIPCYEPYMLSESTKNAPVRFEMEFFNTDNIRYVYSISFTRTEIEEEILDFYPKRQKANIFTRKKGDTWETIGFGGLYKGGTRRIAFFKNNSYLAKAGANAGASELIRSVYKYLGDLLMPVNADDPFSIPMPESFIPTVGKLLCNVDTGISEIEARVNENPAVHLPEKFPTHIKNAILEKAKRDFFFSHRTEEGSVEMFREGMESEGTRKLFTVLPVLIAAFRLGVVVLIDELERSFHPHIAELIIRLFNDPEVNTKNAQLIFTTHSMHLMSSNNFRRDQVWFTEKVEGKTSLYSLDQFDKKKVKSNSPFDTWYDEGRFGAVPKVNYLAIAEILTPPKAED